MLKPDWVFAGVDRVAASEVAFWSSFVERFCHQLIHLPVQLICFRLPGWTDLRSTNSLGLAEGLLIHYLPPNAFNWSDAVNISF